MVLDNSSATTEADSFSESAPASDADPYNSYEGGDSSPQRYQIDMSAFPQPIPILGPLLGWNQQLLQKMITARLQATTKVLQRPLSQEEATAQAFWAAKQLSIFSYATPIGVLGGLWRANSTKQTWRFPFWQPNLETFQSTVFPHAKYPILVGGRAALAWQTLRVVGYGYVGRGISRLIFGSYSATVSAVGELSDPRLKEVVDTLRKKSQERRGALGSQSKQADGTVPFPTPAGLKKQEDDASPTGGMYFDEVTSDSTVGGKTDSAVREEEWSRRDKPQLSKAPNSPPITPEFPERRFDEFDDSSPTEGTRADTSPQSGSAWERIRKGGSGAAGQTKSSWPTTQEKPSGQGGQSAWSKHRENSQEEQHSASGESFSFSKSKEERELAKIEAQKDFDARLERERRGGDFSSSGDQKRW